MSPSAAGLVDPLPIRPFDGPRRRRRAASGLEEPHQPGPGRRRARRRHQPPHRRAPRRRHRGHDRRASAPSAPPWRSTATAHVDRGRRHRRPPRRGPGRAPRQPLGHHVALRRRGARPRRRALPRSTGASRCGPGPWAPCSTPCASSGPTVTEEGEPGHLPVVVSGGATGVGPGGETGVVRLPGDVSSQFVSGLLLAGACLPGGLRVELSTDAVSRPYLEHDHRGDGRLRGHCPRRRSSRLRGRARRLHRHRPRHRTRQRRRPPISSPPPPICGGHVRVEGLGRAAPGRRRFVDVPRLGATVPRRRATTRRGSAARHRGRLTACPTPP